MNKKILYFTALFIATTTFLTYLPALQNDFVQWDDNHYVYENNNIQKIDIKFFKWVSTAVVSANWHPLTLFSYAIDYSLWGNNPRGYHLTNLIFHSINSFLVFILVFKLIFISTNIINRSIFTGAATALLFAIHPLHVESVAWISERKDVLYVFFFLLSLISYIKHISSDNSKNRVFFNISLIFFIFSLLSKPMAVTLPAVLLILDFFLFKNHISQKETTQINFHFIKTAVFDKKLFFLFAILTSITTLWAQQGGGAIKPLETFPLYARILVAAHSFIFYLYKMIIPANLSPYYPFPNKTYISSLPYIAAFILFSAITVICFLPFLPKKNKIFNSKLIKSNRFFSAVWFYYVITLTPVIGIIKVGNMAAADRYTYLPALGPFLFFSTGLSFFFEKYFKKKYITILFFAVIFAFVFLAKRTQTQINIWKDSLTLWSHAIKLYPDSVYMAYNNRGVIYKDKKKYLLALNDFNKAIKIYPEYELAYNNRGMTYIKISKYEKALHDLRLATKLNPVSHAAYHNLGDLYNKTGKYKLAIEKFSTALSLSPSKVKAYIGRGISYSKLGKINQAISNFSKAIELSPGIAYSYFQRGLTYAKSNNHKKAIADFTTAIDKNSFTGEFYYNRGLVYSIIGVYDLAEADFNYTLKLSSNVPVSVFYNRGLVYKQVKKFDKAIADFNKVIKKNPDHLKVYKQLSEIYSELGDKDRVQTLNKKIRILELKNK